MEIVEEKIAAQEAALLHSNNAMSEDLESIVTSLNSDIQVASGRVKRG